MDEPVAVFEPRPTPAPSRPDTVCDGWSTAQYTVRSAAVRGYEHRYRGRPRQDELATGQHPASRSVVFAVADGVSAATHAEQGASIACTAAVETLLHALAAGTEPLPWRELLDRAARRMTRAANAAATAAGQAPPAAEAVERRLGTTLVAGVVSRTPRGDLVRLVQVGDSCAWVLHQGRFSPLLRHKGGGGGPVISSAVEPLPRVPAEIRPVEVLLPPGGVLLVATDGIGDPLGDGTGLVGQLFLETLAAPPSALAMARLLDFSRETFDDDRAAVAIWPLAAENGGQR